MPTNAPNHPHPFNSATTIGFAVSGAAEVHLAIYDLLGRGVGVLFDTEP